MPNQTRDNVNGHGAWQLIGIIVITATLSSVGSGVVSGYLAARAVADQVSREQGERISSLEVRIKAIETQIDKSIEFRLNKLEASE